MKFVHALVISFAFTISPCCAKDTTESLMLDTLAVLNQFVDACAEIRDKSSAKAIKPKLHKILDQLEDLKKRELALGEPNELEIKRFQLKYADQIKSFNNRLAAAQFNVERIPGAVAELKEIGARFDRILVREPPPPDLPRPAPVTPPPPVFP